MAHFTRTQADGTWVNGYAPVQSDFESLDAKQFAAVDGDNGSAHSPAASIVIGGQGLEVDGPTVLFGPAGLLTTGTTYYYANGGFPKLGPTHAGRTRTLVQLLLDAEHGVDPEPDPALTNGSDLPNLLLRNGSSVQFACTDVTDKQLVYAGRPTEFTTYTPSLRMAIRVVDGSTLSQVEFRFSVATARTSPPARMPRFRVFRLNPTAEVTGVNSLAPLQSVAAGADADGFASPAVPSSGAAWYADGEPQSFVYVCDQNNAIDVSTYDYFVEVIEESGNTTAPLAVAREPDVMAVLSQIDPTGNFLTGNIDGSNAAAVGSRVLVLSTVSATPLVDAGIYIVQPVTGNLARDPAYDGAQGSFVRVSNPGTTVKFTYLVLQQQTPGPVSLGRTRLVYSTSPDPANPAFDMLHAGNVYHSAVTTFTNITDTRWQ